MRLTSDSGRKRKQVHAARRRAGVGRECDHRNAARARDLSRRLHRLREERPENDLGAFVDRSLRGLLRAERGAAVVLDQELDIRRIEFGDRELGGIFHRLRDKAGIAGSRQRQDETDLDRAASDRAALRLGRRQLLARARPGPCRPLSGAGGQREDRAGDEAGSHCLRSRDRDKLRTTQCPEHGQFP